MRQSSGNIDGLGNEGVASPAIAFVTDDGYTEAPSEAASAAAASAASASAFFKHLCSCFVLRRQDRRMTLPNRTGWSLQYAAYIQSIQMTCLHAKDFAVADTFTERLT